MTALRSLFSYLQVHGYRGPNPAHPDFVTSTKMPTDGLTPGIPPKQMAALLGVPDDSPIGVRDKGWLALLTYLALRIDELHHLSVGNVARDGEHLVIRIEGKGNIVRKGVVPPLAAKPLKAWLDIADIRDDRNGPLFRPAKSSRGKGIDGFDRKRLVVCHALI